MGKYKYKFRLSDMVPNAWFYKLRDMSHSTRRSRSRNLHNFSTRESGSGSVSGSGSGSGSGSVARKSFTSLTSSPRVSFVPNSHRASYYYSSNSGRRSPSSTSAVNLAKRIDTDLPLETPRKSKRRRRRGVKVLINSPGRKLVSSPSSIIRCNSSGGRESSVSDSTEKATVLADFVTDTDTKRSDSKSNNVIELALSPIRTRSSDTELKNVDHHFHSEDKSKRSNKAEITKGPATNKARKQINISQKRSLAVIKHSSDPYRDFTESMVEMIVANDMRSSGDLEDLLACYLTLNSADYHGVIVKVFKQVWLDLSRLQFIEL